MALPKRVNYTEQDYYDIPEEVRAELIDGTIYYHAAPSNYSHDYVRKLNKYMEAGVREYWIVNPEKKAILVYFFEESAFDVQPYTFQNKTKVNIYEDFKIDFADFSLT